MKIYKITEASEYLGMTMLSMTNYNYWVMKRKIKEFKASLRFVLIENVNGYAAKHDWSEVYWTEKDFAAHEHVTYNKIDQIIVWTMPGNVRVDGFCILDKNDGVFYLQNLVGGINLYTDEQISLNIKDIYII